MRNADIAVYESGMQLQPQRMELYQANLLTDQTRREKSWLCDELQMRNRAVQKDHARNCQEIEELQRIWCAEAERAGQLKYDELSVEQKENPSAMDQLTAQGELLD